MTRRGEKPKVDLYTDGSCFNNGAGGWAFRLITYRDGKMIFKDRQGGIVGGATTSQRAEMIAIIAGLQALKSKCDVRIFTDSKMLVDAWNNRSVRKLSGRKAADEDLWEVIYRLGDHHILRWNHVKAHRKVNPNQHNQSCDTRARQMASSVRMKMIREGRKGEQ